MKLNNFNELSELKQVLNCSSEFLYVLVKEKQIPYFTINNLIYISASDASMLVSQLSHERLNTHLRLIT